MPTPKEILRDNAGAKVSARNKRTGFVVTVYDGFEAGFESEGPDRWFTLCEEHSYLVGHRSRRYAREWMSHPEDWCEECAAFLAAKGSV